MQGRVALGLPLAIFGPIDTDHRYDVKVMLRVVKSQNDWLGQFILWPACYLRSRIMNNKNQISNLLPPPVSMSYRQFPKQCMPSHGSKNPYNR